MCCSVQCSCDNDFTLAKRSDEIDYVSNLSSESIDEDSKIFSDGLKQIENEVFVEILQDEVETITGSQKTIQKTF